MRERILRDGPPYHDSDICVGHNCPYHNPSDHGMKDWPKNFRYDTFSFGLVERMCPHGVGHPDPDSVDWMNEVHDVKEEKYGYGVHGCDGCCWGRGPSGKEDSSGSR